MQKNRWKEIWDNKAEDGDISLKKSEFELFCELKKANGFDVNVKNEENYYSSFYLAWNDFYEVIKKYARREIHSVYEIGCGSGVNLFLFSNRNEKIKVGGIDYSEGLINLARKVVSSDDLICGEAKDIDTEIKYDLVMAESVFQYFTDIEYAEDVLRKMISKSNTITYLGEIHDATLQEEWLENRRKNTKDHDKIYQGLDKMFYRKEWIEKIACEYGKKVIYTNVENEEYWNSKYIFNCFIL